MSDIFVHILDLPHDVHGLTAPNEDGSYTVFLNARDTIERQQEAYRHEVRHIENNDFEKADVQLIEQYAHQAPAKAFKVRKGDFRKAIREALREIKKRQLELEREAELDRIFFSHYDNEQMLDLIRWQRYK